jgi:hypothetical protein
MSIKSKIKLKERSHQEYPDISSYFELFCMTIRKNKQKHLKKRNSTSTERQDKELMRAGTWLK